MFKRCVCFTWFALVALVGPAQAEEIFDPLTLVTQSIDQTRGLSSYAKINMLIKSPSWQRESTLYAWTRGREDALIRFVAPARDAGNALLKQGDKMWTFNPKLNKSIRLPGGMMSQSWAGSDFSYDDMSRSDKWIKYYRLEHVDTEVSDGLKTYTIDAIPFDDAPVVWGKERLRIREDSVLIEALYYDQDMQPLRRMVTTEIGELGGRVMATSMRMMDLEKPESFTEVRYDAMDFDVALEDRLFTLFSLQSRNR
ncbi:MAG: outer membrane lipoprotein-sorting protein [Pseudomonadota bacterium]|nr:outer membrane lipoprotein-sorting protein [Pseudomonadota bacterium]